MEDNPTENILKSNAALVKKKTDAARVILTETYRDAALMFGEKKPASADCDEAVGLFSRIYGNNTDSGECSREFAYFCREFARENPVAFSEDTDDGEDEVPKIAYLQNGFSDKAYSSFSHSFSFITAFYFTEFREVCEEVYNERCSHALLPIYNSRDGMLMSFYRLILKYDLKILSCCEITMNDESAMRYALLAKNLPGALSGKYMDISVVLNEENSFGGLLSSLEILGAEIITLNSYPLEYADDKSGLILHLSIEKSDINAMELYLEGSRFRYTVLGCYDII